MDEIRTALEGKIPFQGQRLADRITQEVIIMGAIVAWVIGYFAQSISLCMSVFGVACLVASLAAIPPWPMYRKHPVVWLPNRPADDGAESDPPSGKL